MVEDALDDVGRHLQGSKIRRESAPEIVQDPAIGAGQLIELVLRQAVGRGFCPCESSWTLGNLPGVFRGRPAR